MRTKFLQHLIEVAILYLISLRDLYQQVLKRLEPRKSVLINLFNPMFSKSDWPRKPLFPPQNQFTSCGTSILCDTLWGILASRIKSKQLKRVLFCEWILCVCAEHIIKIILSNPTSGADVILKSILHLRKVKLKKNSDWSISDLAP